MLRAFHCFTLVLVCTGNVLATNSSAEPARNEPTANSIVDAGWMNTAGVSTVASQVANRADVSMLNARIVPNLVRGSYGENLASHVMQEFFEQGDNWTSISPRLGPQGLDGVYLKMRADGRIQDILTNEVKYGKSQLSQTNFGKQLTTVYTNKKLADMAGNYRKLVVAIRSGQIQYATTPPPQARHAIDVPMGGRERSVTFWRVNSQGPWFTNLNSASSPNIEQQAQLVATFLDGAASGKIAYRRRLSEVKPVGNSVEFTLKDADNYTQGMRRSNLPLSMQTQRFSADTEPFARSYKQAIAAEIRRSNPLFSNYDIAIATEENLRMQKKSHLIQSRALNSTATAVRQVASGTVLATGTGVLADTGMQFYETGEIDGGRLTQTAGIATTAGLIGNSSAYSTTYVALHTNQGFKATQALANSIGMRSTTQAANLGGATAGGGIASLVFAYGGYFAGYYDIETANVSATAGIAGTLASAAAYATTVSLVTTYGVATTGTAISSLSGAAATSATTAAVGGGSTALGGFMLVAGPMAIGVGVTAAIIYGYSIKEEHDETKRLTLMSGYISQHYESKLSVFSRP